MIRTLVFQETSPASAITVASSQPVVGADFNVAAGVAGYGLDDYDSLDITASLVGATGGTLDVFVQGSPDEGANWFDCVHLTSLAAGAAAIIYRTTISSVPVVSAVPVTVGRGLTPLLASGTTVPGLGLDRLRLVMKAGAGTTAGAAVKVFVSGHRTRIREVGT